MLTPQIISEYAKKHFITKAAAAKRLLREQQHATAVLPAETDLETRSDGSDDKADIEEPGAGGSIQ